MEPMMAKQILAAPRMREDFAEVEVMGNFLTVRLA